MLLKGVDTTTQFFDTKYPGTEFKRLEKALLHTTETRGWPGYAGGASAPNATYHPKLRLTRQHFSSNRSSRALRDPDSTVVRENRDNIFQLEIICYSDKRLGDSVGGLWVGDLTEENYSDIADILKQLNASLGLPLKSTVEWREGQETLVSGVRLTGPEFDGYSGILGHMHASGNTHLDPSGFRYSQLAKAFGQTVQPPIVVSKDKFQEALMALPTLKKGSSGVHVRTLQGLLLSHGYDLGRYGPARNGIDGDFGPTTDSKVRSFQERNRVPNSVVNGRGDGIVGVNTRIVLNRGFQ